MDINGEQGLRRIYFTHVRWGNTCKAKVGGLCCSSFQRDPLSWVWALSDQLRGPTQQRRCHALCVWFFDFVRFYPLGLDLPPNPLFPKGTSHSVCLPLE